MSAANKRRGSQFELDVLKHLRAEGFDAERLRLNGAEDEGDIVVKAGGLVYIFELKNEKRIDLASYVGESHLEAANYAKHRNLRVLPHPFAIVKRRQRPVARSYVVCELGDLLRLIGEGQ